VFLTRKNLMPRVSISDTNKIVEVNEGEVLYDSLSSQGENLPHGCLSGSCGACRVEVLSGADHLHPPGLIEKNTIESLKDEFEKSRGAEFVNGKEIRLSCRARVMGDVTIRPIK
jgi:ferredoxin